MPSLSFCCPRIHEILDPPLTFSHSKNVIILAYYSTPVILSLNVYYCLWIEEKKFIPRVIILLFLAEILSIYGEVQTLTTMPIKQQQMLSWL